MKHFLSQRDTLLMKMSKIWKALQKSIYEKWELQEEVNIHMAGNTHLQKEILNILFCIESQYC